MMARRVLWWATWVALLTCVAMDSSAEEPSRPNIVFILVDDLRVDSLGCTGHPFSKTPNIDRLAREGATFRNAFVTTPLCSPSRASFLTGLYAHEHGVRDNRNYDGLSHRLVTFPRLHRDAGYETAYVGKWHMGTDDSPRPGFDRWVSFKGQGQYADPVLNIDGEVKKTEGYITDILSDHAVAFLERRHERPFALYLSHKAVHGPFTPAGRHSGLYADQPIPRPESAEDSLEGKPAVTRKEARAPTKRAAAKKARRRGTGTEVIRNQLRALRSIDEGVGRILEALERAGRLDETLVIFTSDNGYFWGEHGLGDKRWAYEESIRIPLLMRLPGLIEAGSTIDRIALNVDIAPTLLDLAGVAIPADFHGRSLVPLLRGEAIPWREAMLAEYVQEERYPQTPSWQAVRTGRWKLIRYTELEGMDELYDLRADPHELRNLIREPDARSALEALEAELARLRDATR